MDHGRKSGKKKVGCRGSSKRLPEKKEILGGTHQKEARKTYEKRLLDSYKKRKFMERSRTTEK